MIAGIWKNASRPFLRNSTSRIVIFTNSKNAGPELTVVYCYAKIWFASTNAMLGLLQKHCPVCGMDVDKRTATKRFGKYFCSEKHADQYAKMKLEKAEKGGGGCC